MAALRNRTLRRAMTNTDVLVIIGFVAIVAAVLLRPRSRVLGPRAICASNLRGIGQGFHIYADENQGYFPSGLVESSLRADGDFADAGVDYVGMLGSTARLSIRNPTSASVSPQASHPSRALFQLITAGSQTVGQFICPSSPDREDDLRNYGQDRSSGTTGESESAQPGRNRFDFRGYDTLSFGMTLQFGRPLSRDVRMVMLADKGPYFEAGDPFADTRSRPDRRSKIVPPTALGTTREALLARPNSEWKPWNSRNHGGEGQNMLFIDSHVDFALRPLAGPDYDNIYTAATRSDPTGGLIGRVAEPGTESARIAPLTATDVYLVP